MMIGSTANSHYSIVELREMSVLLAEDDAGVRTHISRILTPLCGKLFVAENGRVALDIFRSHMPDIVLADISMPALSGLELARQIKVERPASPVVILSSHDDSEYLLQSINLQLEGYLTKPLNMQKLIGCLQRISTELKSRRLANQQSRLLSGVNMAIQYLLSADANQDAVDFALQEMAKAARADKILLYRYVTDENGERELSLASGFAAGEMVGRFLNGVEPDIPEMPYIERWHSLLTQGKSLSGPRSSFPLDERYVLDGLRLRSVLLTPIFEGASLWGFACLGDIHRERPWSDAETSMVMTAARGLGSFMGRLKLEEERVAAKKSLELANIQWRETFNTIPDMVMVLDTSHRIVHINRAACERMEIDDAESARGVKLCYQHLHGTDQPHPECPHSKLLQDHQPHETDVYIPSTNSYFHITVNPTFDSEGRLAGSVHVARDVTKRREMEDHLRYLSTHDEMTKLYNRAFFEAELEQIERGRIMPVSVVIADLDGLKEANDQFGHDVGDALIVAAADLLRDIFRAGDVISRIGGDEFAVILRGVGEELLATIMERARQIQLERKDLDGYNAVRVRFSFGAATTHHPSRLQDAIKAADMAMYEEKQFRKQNESATC